MISVIFGLCIYLIIGIILSSLFLIWRIDEESNKDDMYETYFASASIIFAWLAWIFIIVFKTYKK
jgi:uncharacterized membrane protein